MEVLDDEPFGRGGGEQLDHPCRVGGVRDEEHVVVGPEVLDEVVDDPAGLGAAHRVLRAPRADASQVVGEAPVDEVGRSRPGHPRLAEVRHVEDADPLADRRVLCHDATARVLDRHRPAPEVRHLRAERDVSVVDRGVQEVGHGRHVTACRCPVRRSIVCAHDFPVAHHPHPRRAAGRCPRGRLRPEPRTVRTWRRATACRPRPSTTSGPSSRTWRRAGRRTRSCASSPSPGSRPRRSS